LYNGHNNTDPKQHSPKKLGHYHLKWRVHYMKQAQNIQAKVRGWV